jgi:hypothetical protein
MVNRVARFHPRIVPPDKLCVHLFAIRKWPKDEFCDDILMIHVLICGKPVIHN